MSDSVPVSFTDSQRLDHLRLFRTENVGPRLFGELINRFGDAGTALRALPELSRRGGRKIRLEVFSAENAMRELEDIHHLKARLICLDETEYPPLLRRIADPPPVLTVKGRTGLTARPAIAIVGARNASALGRKMAAQLAADLGSHGQVIVSGLARGIDACAHEAALGTGTIAVVAGGLDVVYPPEHKALAAAICEQGLMVSEIAMGTRPTRTHFPRRNRLVSGIASGTVIIDAAHRSGSLITARTALEQNREVFAVPGSPLDPRAAGGNGLIRDGATLVRHAEDILNALNPMVRNLFEVPDDIYSLKDADLAPITSPPPEPGAEIRHIVLGLLSVAPIEIDELIRAADTPTRDVIGVLLELELAGRVIRLDGQRVALAP